MITEYTVLRFIKVQFRGVWDRSFDIDKAIYTPDDPNKRAGQLLVVCEEGTGIITYEFLLSLQNNEINIAQVWINWAENLIHIPGICVKSVNSDITKCGG